MTQPPRPRPVNSVFQEDWWLDAVAPGRWGLVEVKDGGGLKAWMPYVFRDAPAGLVRCDTPPLTQTLGPWLAPPTTTKYWKALGKDHSLIAELIEQLPAADLFRQNLHYSVPTAMPFAHAGYDLGLAYTYVIEGVRDLAATQANLSDARRRALRRSANTVEVVETDDLDAYWRLNSLTYARQGVAPPYTRDYMGRVDAACAKHDARRIFIARDEAGRDCAAVYVVFNEHATYYLAGGSDPDLTSAGGASAAMWRAIEFASTRSEVFDFEGSMLPGVEAYFRGFGGQQKPYVQVQKLTPRMRVGLGAREAVGALKGKLAALRRRG